MPQVPVSTLQMSFVQGLPSLGHTMGVPGTQLPAAQTSVSVHGLSSLQGTVLATPQRPVAMSQMSSVQTLPSLAHYLGVLQSPVKKLQVSSVQRLPSSAQVFGVPGWQVGS